jgi:hypothetical protein
MGGGPRSQRSATIKSRPGGCNASTWRHSTPVLGRLPALHHHTCRRNCFARGNLFLASANRTTRTRSTGRHISGGHHAAKYAQTRWMWSRLTQKLRRSKGNIPVTIISTQNCGFQLSLPLSAKPFSLLNQYPAIYHLECYPVRLVPYSRIVALYRFFLDGCCTASVNAESAKPICAPGPVTSLSQHRVARLSGAIRPKSRHLSRRNLTDGIIFCVCKTRTASRKHSGVGTQGKWSTENRFFSLFILLGVR